MSKTWFITGAASGIGYHLTSLLLARGENVAATSRNIEPLKALACDRLWTSALDVTDTAAIHDVVAGAVDRFARLDVVVSNAGFGVLGAAEELSDELLRQQIEVNLIGSIQLARAVLPRLRAQGGGRIVQMSSSGGRVGDPGMSLYNTTKFGIEGFYDSVATELAPFGVEVTLIEPGGTRTGFNGNLALAEPIPAYENGILGQLRNLLGGAADPELLRQAVPGDPARIAGAIVDSVATAPAPRRIVLGGGAHAAISSALHRQLAELDAQRDLAYSTDADDVLA
jgi:NAD(P)-dependent dehydrogenase (short-subunit alcohol dehydrogenase family)